MFLTKKFEISIFMQGGHVHRTHSTGLSIIEIRQSWENYINHPSWLVIEPLNLNKLVTINTQLVTSFTVKEVPNRS